MTGIKTLFAPLRKHIKCFPFSVRRKNLKVQLYFSVKPTVHTNPSRKRNGVFRKHSSISVDRKHFENEAFGKRWRHDHNHVTSLPELSSNTNPKWPVIVAFSNSSGVVWMKKIWSVLSLVPRVFGPNCACLTKRATFESSAVTGSILINSKNNENERK